jgi:peptidoglycan/LPS O-acetylase OafA/YrhL
MLLSAALTGYMVLNGEAVKRGRWTVRPGRAIHRILESGPLAFLGRISYSLYLTHYGLWQVMQNLVERAPPRRWFDVSLDPLPIRALVVVPLTVLGAFAFYLLFERPLQKLS